MAGWASPNSNNDYNGFRASRVDGVFFKRLFGAARAIRLRNLKGSILTLYTLTTLARKKKTKGYGRPSVQGIQGSSICYSSTLAVSPAVYAPDEWELAEVQNAGGWPVSADVRQPSEALAAGMGCAAAAGPAAKSGHTRVSMVPGRITAATSAPVISDTSRRNVRTWSAAADSMLNQSGSAGTTSGGTSGMMTGVVIHGSNADVAANSNTNIRLA